MKVDGILGEATLSAIVNYPDHDRLVAAIVERRFAFLKALKTWNTSGRGWNRPVVEVQLVGQAWVMGSVGPKVTYLKGSEAKARIEDAKTVPGKTIADATAGGGVVGATITQATDALTPASGIPAIQKVLTIVTVIGAVIAVAAIAYRVWAKSKQDAIDDALDRKIIQTDPANDNEQPYQAEAA